MKKLASIESENNNNSPAPRRSPKRVVGNRPPSKVSKEFGADHVQLDVLDEAYRQAKIRLQMCQSSLLFKFNDDDRRIFAQLRQQLTETYEKIKRSNCCISAY